MRAERFIWLVSTLLITIFIGAHLLLHKGLASWRLDLTEHRLYSISAGTRATLADLDEPVELTLVYTRRVGQAYPAVRAHAARLREILQSYKAHSAGKLRIREIDPQPFSSAEDEALASGLVAVETNEADPLYFGLIGRNTVDDERVIPFLAPEREARFEYDLTRMIARLNQPSPSRIGLLSTLDGMNGLGEDSGYTIQREISKSFILEPIEADFLALPEDLDILMLAHPPVLTDWQLWQIDQFILRQGRALILLDPAAKIAQGGGPFNLTDRQIRSDLDHFAESWGVRLSKAALADTATALAIRAESSQGRSRIVNHPLFLSIGAAFMSRDNPVTADLRRVVNLGAAGRLILSDEAPGQRDILIETGPAPSQIEAQAAAGNLSAEDVIGMYQAGTDGAAVLAVQITGKLKSAFPGGRPVLSIPDDPIYGELARSIRESAAPHIQTSQTDAQIIMISDADLLDDALHLDRETGVAFADNISFVLNALDSLSGGSELMGLRARAPALRPMARVERMREQAQTRFFDEQARLEAHLLSTQERLEELQSIGATGGFYEGDVSAELSQEERIELSVLREEIISTRARLRQIERDFRHDIDRLETRLRLFTILGGPAGLILLGFLFHRRRLRGSFL